MAGSRCPGGFRWLPSILTLCLCCGFIVDVVLAFMNLIMFCFYFYASKITATSQCAAVKSLDVTLTTGHNCRNEA